jgi:chromosome segregation ATPase
VDDPELDTHRHRGCLECALRILWRRYWHQEKRLDRLSAQLDRLSSREHRTEELMADQQVDLDAVAQRVTDLKNTLSADDAALAQAIADLQAQAQGQGVTLDFTSVNAALDDLSSQVDATAALVPPPADQPPAA